MNVLEAVATLVTKTDTTVRSCVPIPTPALILQYTADSDTHFELSDTVKPVCRVDETSHREKALPKTVMETDPVTAKLVLMGAADAPV